MAKSPAWQRAEGKNPEGGLNEKGRASLRAAGHDIKRPQPEGGSRKDSFCARMKGMKEKLTSSETANDPDSRINKSLRKWNCHADGGAIDVARRYRADGGKLDAYEEWKKNTDRANKMSEVYRDPIDQISPEEYRKGILDKGKYALARGGRPGYATGGEPTAIDRTNPVLAQPDPNLAYVQSLYQNIMGRSGEKEGVDFWTNQLNQGNLTQSDILREFAKSGEFQNSYKQDPNKAVSSLYKTALYRDPEQEGLNYWVNQAKGGMDLGQMVSGFTGSQEGQTVNDINLLSQALTGKLATPELIQQAMPGLGPDTDYFDFISKTFPAENPEEGVEYARNNRTRSDVSGDVQYAPSDVWKQVSGSPIGSGGREFLDLIGTGEGNYNTARVNTGKGVKADYGYSIGDKPLSQATIADVIAQQQAGKINAVGKYQFIPKVLKEIIQQSGIDPNQPFDEAMQDKLALFRAYNARPHLRDYLEGKSDNRRAAMIDLAREWASMPHPDTGRTVYSGNKANHTIGQIKTALDTARNNMWQPPTQVAGVPNNVVSQDQNLGVTLANVGAGGNVGPIAQTLTNPNPSVMPGTSVGGYQPPFPGTTSGASVISPIPGSGVPAWTPQGMTPSGPMSLYDTLGAGMYTAYYPQYGQTGGQLGGSFGGATAGGTSSGSSGFAVSFGPGMASGGAVDIARSYRKAGGPVWDKPRPKSLGKPEKLSPDEKSSAKAAAKAAGRPYPNLVDNMRAAREDGGRLSPFMEAKIRDIGDAELGKYGIGPNAPSSTKDELKAGPEQSTWESIAEKAMGERPSPERRRFVEGMGTAADVAHMGSYLTPLAPYVGAIDFARGVASGDPMEAALGATGLPGKGAKAAGMAASAMMPDEAKASPYTKMLMELAEKYRPHYDPAARIFGQPRDKWLSDVKLSRPIEEMRVTSQEHRPMVAERFTRPEDYAGKAMITGLGDRTPAGYEVTSINDRILNMPTDMRGGRNFGLDVSSLGPDKAVWGSALSRAQAIANKAKAAADKDYEPIFTYVAQGPQSGDFSHHMQDLVLGQMNPSRMDPKLAEAIDKRMREAQTASGETFAPKPEWVGVQSPDAAARMKARADERVKLIKLMDAAAYRDAPGFADVGASRFASTDPGLLHDPAFSAGKSFMSIDPTGRVVTDPVHPHPSYDTFIPAAPGTGHGYLGRFEYELPPELHFRHYLENEIKPELRGKPLDKQTMSLLRQHPTVMATPEWVDTASEWQDIMRRMYGSRKP